MLPLFLLLLLLTSRPLFTCDSEAELRLATVPVQTTSRPLFMIFWKNTYFEQVPKDIWDELMKFLNVKIWSSPVLNFWIQQDQLKHGGIRMEKFPGAIIDIDRRGNLALLSPAPNVFELYDIAKREIIRTYRFSENVLRIEFSFDGNLILVHTTNVLKALTINRRDGSPEDSIVYTDNNVARQGQGTQCIFDVAADAENNRIYQIGRSPAGLFVLSIFDLIDGKRIDHLCGTGDATRDKTVQEAFFIDNGRKIVIEYTTLEIEIFDIVNRTVTAQFSLISSEITNSVSTLNLSDCQFSTIQDRFLIYNVLTQKVVSDIPIEKSQRNINRRYLAYDKKHLRLAINNNYQRITFIDALSGQVLLECKTTDKVFRPQGFSNNGTRLILKNRSCLLQLVDPEIQMFLDTASYEQRFLLVTAFNIALKKWSKQDASWQKALQYFEYARHYFSLHRAPEKRAPEEPLFCENDFWITVFKSLPKRLQETIAMVFKEGPAETKVVLL